MEGLFLNKIQQIKGKEPTNNSSHISIERLISPNEKIIHSEERISWQRIEDRYKLCDLETIFKSGNHYSSSSDLDINKMTPSEEDNDSDFFDCNTDDTLEYGDALSDEGEINYDLNFPELATQASITSTENDTVSESQSVDALQLYESCVDTYKESATNLLMSLEKYRESMVRYKACLRAYNRNIQHLEKEVDELCEMITQESDDLPTQKNQSHHSMQKDKEFMSLEKKESPRNNMYKQHHKILKGSSVDGKSHRMYIEIPQENESDSVLNLSQEGQKITTTWNSDVSLVSYTTKLHRTISYEKEYKSTLKEIQQVANEIRDLVSSVSSQLIFSHKTENNVKSNKPKACSDSKLLHKSNKSIKKQLHDKNFITRKTKSTSNMEKILQYPDTYERYKVLVEFSYDRGNTWNSQAEHGKVEMISNICHKINDKNGRQLSQIPNSLNTIERNKSLPSILMHEKPKELFRRSELLPFKANQGGYILTFNSFDSSDNVRISKSVMALPNSFNATKFWSMELTNDILNYFNSFECRTPNSFSLLINEKGIIQNESRTMNLWSPTKLNFTEDQVITKTKSHNSVVPIAFEEVSPQNDIRKFTTQQAKDMQQISALTNTMFNSSEILKFDISELISKVSYTQMALEQHDVFQTCTEYPIKYRCVESPNIVPEEGSSDNNIYKCIEEQDESIQQTSIITGNLVNPTEVIKVDISELIGNEDQITMALEQYYPDPQDTSMRNKIEHLSTKSITASQENTKANTLQIKQQTISSSLPVTSSVKDTDTRRYGTDVMRTLTIEVNGEFEESRLLSAKPHKIDIGQMINLRGTVSHANIHHNVADPPVNDAITFHNLQLQSKDLEVNSKTRAVTQAFLPVFSTRTSPTRYYQIFPRQYIFHKSSESNHHLLPKQKPMTITLSLPTIRKSSALSLRVTPLLQHNEQKQVCKTNIWPSTEEKEHFRSLVLNYPEFLKNKFHLPRHLQNNTPSCGIVRLHSSVEISQKSKIQTRNLLDEALSSGDHLTTKQNIVLKQPCKSKTAFEYINLAFCQKQITDANVKLSSLNLATTSVTVMSVVNQGEQDINNGMCSETQTIPGTTESHMEEIYRAVLCKRESQSKLSQCSDSSYYTGTSNSEYELDIEDAPEDIQLLHEKDLRQTSPLISKEHEENEPGKDYFKKIVPKSQRNKETLLNFSRTTEKNALNYNHKGNVSKTKSNTKDNKRTCYFMRKSKSQVQKADLLNEKKKRSTSRHGHTSGKRTDDNHTTLVNYNKIHEVDTVDLDTQQITSTYKPSTEAQQRESEPMKDGDSGLFENKLDNGQCFSTKSNVDSCKNMSVINTIGKTEKSNRVVTESKLNVIVPSSVNLTKIREKLFSTASKLPSNQQIRHRSWSRPSWPSEKYHKRSRSDSLLYNDSTEKYAAVSRKRPKYGICYTGNEIHLPQEQASASEKVNLWMTNIGVRTQWGRCARSCTAIKHSGSLISVDIPDANTTARNKMKLYAKHTTRIPRSIDVLRKNSKLSSNDSETIGGNTNNTNCIVKSTAQKPRNIITNQSTVAATTMKCVVNKNEVRRNNPENSLPYVQNDRMCTNNCRTKISHSQPLENKASLIPVPVKRTGTSMSMDSRIQSKFQNRPVSRPTSARPIMVCVTKSNTNIKNKAQVNMPVVTQTNSKPSRLFVADYIPHISSSGSLNRNTSKEKNYVSNSGIPVLKLNNSRFQNTLNQQQSPSLSVTRYSPVCEGRLKPSQHNCALQDMKVKNQKNQGANLKIPTLSTYKKDQKIALYVPISSGSSSFHTVLKMKNCQTSTLPNEATKNHVESPPKVANLEASTKQIKNSISKIPIRTEAANKHLTKITRDQSMNSASPTSTI